MLSMAANIAFQGTAGKLRLPVASTLRPPAAGYLKRFQGTL
jgi:hypothetical protein